MICHLKKAGFDFYVVTPSGKPVIFEMRAMPNKDENVKIYIMNIKINLKDQET